MAANQPLLATDLQNIFEQCKGIWPQLSGARLFITGGTGFIGTWLLESLNHAALHAKIDIQATILTRNFNKFQQKAPHLADNPIFSFLEGSVTDPIQTCKTVTHVIHAATDASAALIEGSPLTMYDTVITGTRQILDFALHSNARRVLFLSSGAVYGQQPWHLTHITEDWCGGPDCLNPGSTYAEAKRAAEMLCAIYHKTYGLEIAISRIFALLGPYMPLDGHFAAGNFIHDAINGRTITVKGNGLPERTYLYISDLIVWLWHLLIRAPALRPYNCGSNNAVSIAGLASLISTTLKAGECQILGAQDKGWNPGRYVPDISRMEKELGLKPTTTLEEAIRKTAKWHGWKEI